MRRTLRKWLAISIAVIIGLAACAPATPTVPAQGQLDVKILYPTASSGREMGQSLKAIVEVRDAGGQRLTDAQVTLTLFDAAGQQVASLPAEHGSADLYRTSAWTIPFKQQPGTWKVEADARARNARGAAATTFQLKNSLSEDLMHKYGFWVAAPSLRGIVSTLVKEQGDAQDGAIIWGGVMPAQHIFPESWLEIHWRHGDFHLSTSAQVREFMLATLGNLGFTPLRGLGPFEKTRFKNWDAWQGVARGQYTRYDIQWVVFYAPEVDKTYAISTTAVLPPTGIDPHATLRDSFELHPELAADGKAPTPLPHLGAPLELTSPPLGSRVMGDKEPIVLKWQPAGGLAADQYYQVQVDYNYSETNTTLTFTTRETQLALPLSLYDQPNCGVFNWQVTLMQQTGTAEDGQPEGKPLSYDSLYWYVEWFHPAGEDMPFTPRCPNPQT